MNYTIYPSTVNAGQSQMSNTVPVGIGSQGQRAIVLAQLTSTLPLAGQTTSAPQPLANASGNVNSGTGQQAFPMVMQMGSSNGMVFYTYQNPENISQVSPVQNSPTSMQNVNITSENKSVQRSLGEIFNVQALPQMQDQQAVNQSNGVGNNVLANINNQQVTQSSNELAKLLSSLQTAGVQLVETNSSTTKTSLVVPVIATSGLNVVDSNSDNTLSIPLGNHSIEENSFESKIA